MEAITDLRLVELYDGRGQHLGGIYPPLVEGNQLSDAYHASKALRPAGAKLFLLSEDADAEAAFVWMLPLGMTRETLLPREIAGELVQAIDNRKAVMLHGDDPEIVQRVRRTIALFAGGGHA